MPFPAFSAIGLAKGALSGLKVALPYIAAAGVGFALLFAGKYAGKLEMKAEYAEARAELIQQLSDARLKRQEGLHEIQIEAVKENAVALARMELRAEEAEGRADMAEQRLGYQRKVNRNAQAELRKAQQQARDSGDTSGSSLMAPGVRNAIADSLARYCRNRPSSCANISDTGEVSNEAEAGFSDSEILAGYPQ